MGKRGPKPGTPVQGGARKGVRPKNRPQGKGNWASSDAKGTNMTPFVEGDDEYSAHIRALARDPKHMESKIPMRELTLRTWVDVAKHSDNDSARVGAAEKLAERMGLPKEPAVSINVSSTAGKSIAELDAEIDRLTRELDRVEGRTPASGEDNADTPVPGIPEAT